MSTPYTSSAPKARANCTAEMPSPPTPNTATLSPGFTPALLRAWNDVADEHIMIAPCSKEISSGKGMALREGTTMYSA